MNLLINTCMQPYKITKKIFLANIERFHLIRNNKNKQYFSLSLGL